MTSTLSPKHDPKCAASTAAIIGTRCDCGLDDALAIAREGHAAVMDWAEHGGSIHGGLVNAVENAVHGPAKANAIRAMAGACEAVR